MLTQGRCSVTSERHRVHTQSAHVSSFTLSFKLCLCITRSLFKFTLFMSNKPHLIRSVLPSHCCPMCLQCLSPLQDPSQRNAQQNPALFSVRLPNCFIFRFIHMVYSWPQAQGRARAHFSTLRGRLGDFHMCRQTHRAAGRAEASSFRSPERTRWHLQAGCVSCSHASGHWAGSGGGASSLWLRTVNRTGRVPTPGSGKDGSWALLSLKERGGNGSTQCY